MAENHSPLHQFEISTIIPLPTVAGVDLSLTNAALFMMVTVFACAALMIQGMRHRNIIPCRMQMLIETLHDAIAGMVAETAGEKSRPYFPFVMTLFLFIMMANMLGLLPYAFTVTGQVVVTVALGFLVFALVTLTGFVRHGTKFLSLFVPPGISPLMMPVMFVIELVSFCIRPFTLGIRLFANMMAGGILLKVFAGMIATMVVAGLAIESQEPSLLQLALAPLPFILLVVLTGFKLFVAALQAYIFSILTAVYLHDALEMH